MTPPASTAIAACLNCGASLAIVPEPRHCPQCGQPVLPPPWRRLARETLARYLRTVAALVGRPGRLTQQYLAGRREHYLPPLRLYLAASFLFFFAIHLLGTGPGQVFVASGIDAHGRPVPMRADSPEYRKAIASIQACRDPAGSCSWVDRMQARLLERALAQAGRENGAVSERLLAMAPNAIFVLLPVFAAIVMAAYRGRRLPYGTHLVFSLHMHAFAFLALLLVWKLPTVAAPAGAALLIGHALLALRRVYGGRWVPTVARTALISTVYGVTLVLAVIVLSTASIMLS